MYIYICIAHDKNTNKISTFGIGTNDNTTKFQYKKKILIKEKNRIKVLL